MTKTTKNQIMKVLAIALIALGLLVLLNIAPATLLVAAAILTGVLMLLGW
jgi:uncharacterized membrane protein HdeD (DUF308 family)